MNFINGVKAAAGTEATAPEHQKALKVTKGAPENTVQVENPAKVLADRGPKGEDHVLKAMGFDDEDIADMSAAERKANLRDAVESGMSLPKAARKRAPGPCRPPTRDRRATGRQPTPAHAEAGNYKKGHLKIDGLNVTIENGKGSIRSGTGPDGKPWSTTMPAHYGYVKGTEGADGDQVDVFVGDNRPAAKIYVIDQFSENGKFGEHKAILGVATPREAMDLYRKAFSDGKGHERFGGMKVMETGAFRDCLNQGAQNQPLAAVETKKPAPKGLGKPVPLVRFLAAEGGHWPDQELSTWGSTSTSCPAMAGLSAMAPCSSTRRAGKYGLRLPAPRGGHNPIAEKSNAERVAKGGGRAAENSDLSSASGHGAIGGTNSRSPSPRPFLRSRRPRVWWGPPPLAGRSGGRLRVDHGRDRLQHEDDIHPQRPVADIGAVEGDAILVAERGAAADLPQAGQAGARAEIVGRMGSIALESSSSVTGRGPTQLISPRRMLINCGSSVQARLAQQAPQRRDARIILQLARHRPFHGGVGIGRQILLQHFVSIGHHGAKLPMRLGLRHIYRIVL